MKLITENQINQIVRESILNEISQQAKSRSFVKANTDIANLQQMKKGGQRTFNKNGRVVDIDNEINRRQRQMDTFGKGLSHDISMEYDKNRDKYKQKIEQVKSDLSWCRNMMEKVRNGEIKDEDGSYMSRLKEILDKNKQLYKQLISNPNGYHVHTLGNDGYSIQTPNGRVYSHSDNNGFQYSDNNPSNVNRLSKIQGITDAMMGYDDELNGQMDKKINSLRRRQQNVQALRDYDDAYNRWETSDREARQAQEDYDRLPFFKKWFKKRPVDGPQKPKKPTWYPNENGEFDGYFSHTNPSDYDNDIDNVSQRQKHYRNARDNYFKR